MTGFVEYHVLDELIIHQLTATNSAFRNETAALSRHPKSQLDAGDPEKCDLCSTRTRIATK